MDVESLRRPSKSFRDCRGWIRRRNTAETMEKWRNEAETTREENDDARQGFLIEMTEERGRNDGESCPK